MDREQVARWVGRYERAWRTAGGEPLRALFTEDAQYRQSPYRAPVVGLDAIAAMWDAEREGPDEVFRMTSLIEAVEGDTAVVRTQVWYGEPVTQEYRNLWVIRFAEDDRCRDFEEWFFAPE